MTVRPSLAVTAGNKALWTRLCAVLFAVLIIGLGALIECTT